MSDEDPRMAMAMACWERAQPEIRRAFIREFLEATNFVPTVVADWVKSMPFGPGATVADRPTPLTAETATPTSPAGGEPKELRGDPQRARSARPLKGLSAITYELVKNSDGPIKSRDLLNKLRDQDDQEKSDSRDNSLMAAIRRLKNAGYLAYENDYYSIAK